MNDAIFELTRDVIIAKDEIKAIQFSQNEIVSRVESLLEHADDFDGRLLHRHDEIQKELENFNGSVQALKKTVATATEPSVIANEIKKVMHESKKEFSKELKILFDNMEIQNRAINLFGLWKSYIPAILSFSISFLILGFLIGVGLNDTLTVNIKKDYPFLIEDNGNFFIPSSLVTIQEELDGYLLQYKPENKTVTQSFQSGLLYLYHWLGLGGLALLFSIFGMLCANCYFLAKRNFGSMQNILESLKRKFSNSTKC